MIKNIIKDEYLLVKKSDKFIPGEDDHIITDLLDTANAHKDNCAGLAAVQIGYYKRAIVVKIGGKFVPLINPRIIQRYNGTYNAVEGCLSVEGEHLVKRHRNIRVAFTDMSGKERVMPYEKYVAQIIQHECDHLDGILI